MNKPKSKPRPEQEHRRLLKTEPLFTPSQLYAGRWVWKQIIIHPFTSSFILQRLTPPYILPVMIPSPLQSNLLSFSQSLSEHDPRPHRFVSAYGFLGCSGTETQELTRVGKDRFKFSVHFYIPVTVYFRTSPIPRSYSLLRCLILPSHYLGLLYVESHGAGVFLLSPFMTGFRRPPTPDSRDRRSEPLWYPETSLRLYFRPFKLTYLRSPSLQRERI